MRAINIYLSTLFGIVLTLSTHADIPAQETYGLYNAILEEYRHLSPFHGFVCTEQDIFYGFYFYTQESEPVYKLMRELFRFIDTLISHVSDSIVGTHLDASMMGKLLATVEKNLDRSSGIIIISKDALKKQLIEVLHQTGTRMKQKTKVGPRENFAQILVDALDDCGHWGSANQHYPQFLAHIMLLTLLFKKVTNKADYQIYFDQFKMLNDGNGILKPNAQTILAEPYQHAAITSILTASTIQPLEYYLDNYELFAYSLIKTQKYSGIYPPRVLQGTPLLSWYKENAPERIKYGFADCAEIVLLNLLSFIEFKADTNSYQGSIAYFKQFTPETIQSQDAREAWSDLISNIPGVAYNQRVKKQDSPEEKSVIINENAEKNNNKEPWVKPAQGDGWYYYELEPTLPNFVKIINILYGLQLNNFGEFLNRFNLECGSYKGTLAEQTQGVCTITDQNKRSCTFEISKAHGVTSAYPLVAIQKEEMQRMLLGHLSQQIPSNKSLLPLLNIFGINIYDINQAISFHYMRYIFLSQRLEYQTVKTNVLEVALAKASFLKKDAWYRSFIMRIADSLLSLNDNYTTVTVLQELASYAYAWDLFAEFIARFKSRISSLELRSKLVIISRIGSGVSPEISRSHQTVFDNFILELFDLDKTVREDILYYIPQDNLNLINKLFDKIFSDENLERIAQEKPNDLENTVERAIGKGLDLKKSPAQIKDIIIMRIIPKLRSFSSINSLIKITEAYKTIGIDATQEIILALLPKISADNLLFIISWIKQFPNYDQWSTDFMNRLGAAAKNN